jgi:hypothetical protein
MTSPADNRNNRKLVFISTKCNDGAPRTRATCYGNLRYNQKESRRQIQIVPEPSPSEKRSPSILKTTLSGWSSLLVTASMSRAAEVSPKESPFEETLLVGNRLDSAETTALSLKYVSGPTIHVVKVMLCSKIPNVSLRKLIAISSAKPLQVWTYRNHMAECNIIKETNAVLPYIKDNMVCDLKPTLNISDIYREERDR